MGDDVRDKVSTPLNQLDTWIEKEKFQGWDPYDALNSPILKTLSFGNRFMGIIWVQLFKRLPVNLRPLLRVPKGYNPKGMGLFLSSYLRKFQMTGYKTHLEKVDFFSQCLRDNISPGYSGACWGYNFDWPNRGFFIKAGIPTIVNTAFIGASFLDIFKFMKTIIPENERKQALDISRSACDFIQKDLNTLKIREDEICFSYTPQDKRFVHNANLLGAQLLAEVAVQTNEEELADLACIAARYSMRCQEKDGSWYYGEASYDRWIDNFHTGFILVSLKRIAKCLDIQWLNSSIELGYEFWKKRMFLSNGIPKYYARRIYPIDTHSVAQSIITFLEFADHDSEAMHWAHLVAKWGIENMQDRQGYFHYQINQHFRIRIPYMRWSQAWMQRALSELVWVRYCEDLG